MNSRNPFFKTNSYTKSTETYDAVVIDNEQTMTVGGTINKSFMLLLLLVAGATITWNMAYNGQNPFAFIIGGAIVGIVCALITTFKPQLSTYLSPAYAVAEGLFIGGISAIFEVMYPGIVIQAVSCTFVTFLVCLALYKFKIVQVTEKFRSIVLAATLAIEVYYLFSWLL